MVVQHLDFGHKTNILDKVNILVAKFPQVLILKWGFYIKKPLFDNSKLWRLKQRQKTKNG